MLGGREALPIAEGDLLQDRLGAVALGSRPIAARRISIVSRVQASGLATKSNSAASGSAAFSAWPLRLRHGRGAG